LKQTVKKLAMLSLPPVFGMLGNMTMNMVDTAFGGHLGAETLAGMAVGDAIFQTLAVVCGATVMGGMNFVAARAYGAGDLAGCHRALVNGVYISLFAAAIAMTLIHVATLCLIPLGIEPAIASGASMFANNLIWGLLPGLLVVLVMFYLQSMSVFAFALPLMVVSNLLNAFGDWLLMTGHWGFPALGIAGCAWSTNIARCFSLAVLVGYVLVRDRKLAVRLVGTSLAPSRAVIGQMAGAGGPFAVQQFLQFAAQAVGTLLVGRLGIASVAAFRVVSQLMGASLLLAVGVSSGCAALVAQRLGAKDPAGAARAGWIATGFSTTIALTFWLALFVFARPVLTGFTPDAAVVEIGVTLVMISALVQIPAAIEIALTGALRGGGGAGMALIASAGAAWLIALPLAWTFAFPLGLGVTGFWMGFGLGKVCAALGMAFVWWRRTRELNGPQVAALEPA
jgi:MATE family multidrug resistance protein